MQVIGYKCSPQKVNQVVQSLSDIQKEWVRELGFVALLEMPACRMLRGLTLWLIDQSDWRRGTLVIRGQHVKIRKLVKKMLGIPDGSIEVPMPRGRG